MSTKKAFQIIILSFFGGIFLIPFAPGIFLMICIGLILSVCGYTLTYQKTAVSTCISIIIGVVISGCVYGYHTQRMNEYFAWVSSISSMPWIYNLYIESYQKRGKQGDQVVGVIVWSGAIWEQHIKVLINTDTNIRPEIWKTIQAYAKLSIPINSENFGYRNYLLSKWIGFTTELESFSYVDTPQSWEERRGLWIYKSLEVREYIYWLLRNIIPEESSNFLSGMIFGDTSRLSDEYEELARSTGISHLLVVSGFNISLILICLSGILFWMPRYIKIPLIIAGVVWFVWIVGGGIPALRAACMGIIWFLITQSGRYSDIKSVFLAVWAAFIIYNPLSIYYDMSFLLSFGATGAIIIFYEKIYQWVQSRAFYLPKIIQESASVTISAMLWVLPIMILVFGEISWVSIPLNTLIGPIVAPVTIAGIIAVLSEWLWWHKLGVIVGQIAHWWYTIIIDLAELFRTYGPSNTSVSISQDYYLALMTMIILWWVYVFIKKTEDK